MGKKCCVLGCSNKQGAVTLHSFIHPSRDPSRFLKWIVATGNSNLLKLQPEKMCGRYFICTVHFAPEHKHGNDCRLMNIAYPTLHLPAPLQIPEFWLSTDMENKENQQYKVNLLTSEYWSISYTSEAKGANSSPRKQISPPTDAGYSQCPSTSSRGTASTKHLTYSFFALPVSMDEEPASLSTDMQHPRDANEPVLITSKADGEGNTDAVYCLKKAHNVKQVYKIPNQVKTNVRNLKKWLRYFQERNLTYKKRLILAERENQQITKLSPLVLQFYNRQVQNLNVEKKGRRFTDKDKILALALYKQSAVFV